MRGLLTAAVLLCCSSELLANSAVTAPTSGEHDQAADLEAESSIDRVRFGCGAVDMAHPLGLLDVVALALCSQVATRKAWAEIAQASAELGVARGDYWPTLNASAYGGFSRNSASAENAALYSYETTVKQYGESLDLSWKIYDFGMTQKQTNSAKFALLSAISNKDAAVQTVTLNASEAFYDVITAEAEVTAELQAEAYAAESLRSAQRRYDTGLAAITDKLQAETAYSAAKVKRITAEGDLKDAQGALCAIVGREANVVLPIDRTEAPLPDADISASIEELIEDAKRNNPDLESARSAAAAAYENYNAVQLETKPTLTIVGSMREQIQRSASASNIQSFIEAPADNATHNRNIQLRVTFPLFDGFTHRNKVNEARSLAEQGVIAAQENERQLTLQVWKAYHDLRTQSETYTASIGYLANASELYKAAQGRYIAGMGTAIDLLNAQAAMASADEQRIASLAKWRDAKLKLAATVGRLKP